MIEDSKNKYTKEKKLYEKFIREAEIEEEDEYDCYYTFKNPMTERQFDAVYDYIKDNLDIGIIDTGYDEDHYWIQTEGKISLT